jgi:hypothetical protein
MSFERLKAYAEFEHTNHLAGPTGFQESIRIVPDEVAHEQYIRSSLISKLYRSERYAPSKTCTVTSSQTKRSMCSTP